MKKKKQKQEKQNKKLDILSLVLTIASIAIPIALVIFTLWIPMPEKPLFFATNRPFYDSKPFYQTFYNTKEYDWAIISAIRCIFSKYIGIVYESRIYFSLIMFGCYISYYFSFNDFFKSVKNQKNLLLNIIAATFSILNPFFVNRLILGHDRILIAYAITPLMLVTSWKLITGNIFNIESYIKILSLSLLIVFISPHFLPFLIIYLILFAIFAAKTIGRKLKQKSLVIENKKQLIVFSLLSVISIFLIYLTFNRVIEKTQTIKLADAEIWATRSDKYYNILINTLSLYGYWVEKGILNTSKQLWSKFWIVIPIVYLTFFIQGLITIFNAKSDPTTTKTKTANKSLVYLIISTFLIFLLLSLGQNTIFSAGSVIFENLFDTILLRGMREAQKFQAFIAIYYVLIIPIGLSSLKGHEKLLNKTLILLGSICFLITSSLTLFFNGNNQVKQCNYPSEVIDLANSLDKDDKVLILNFSHSYFNFCNIFIENPFGNVFYADVETGFDAKEEYDVILYAKSETFINPINPEICYQIKETDDVYICKINH
ncbi:hypothetical protein JW887_02430 [Candidatus Dojkabacteria bacterium]|nr:hypothetical protein [Candidatus Dojkabacteria bacterium]